MYLAKHNKAREVKKGQYVIDAYNIISRENALEIIDIPAYPREVLLSLPYLVLVWIVAIDKKKRLDWGRPKIRSHYNISDREARNICSAVFK